MDLAAIIDDVRRRLEGRGSECGIDEVVALCPNMTWNQVFLAIDHLSRTGQIQLSLDQARSYKVKVLPSPPFFRQNSDALVT